MEVSRRNSQDPNMIFSAYLLLLAAGPLLAGPSMDKNLYSKEKDPGIISVEGLKNVEISKVFKNFLLPTALFVHFIFQVTNWTN